MALGLAACEMIALLSKLTETNLLVVSDTSCSLLCQEFFGVKEHSGLLLESSLSLNNNEDTRVSRLIS